MTQPLKCKRIYRDFKHFTVGNFYVSKRKNTFRIRKEALSKRIDAK